MSLMCRPSYHCFFLFSLLVFLRHHILIPMKQTSKTAYFELLLTHFFTIFVQYRKQKTRQISSKMSRSIFGDIDDTAVSVDTALWEVSKPIVPFNSVNPQTVGLSYLALIKSTDWRASYAMLGVKPRFSRVRSHIRCYGNQTLRRFRVTSYVKHGTLKSRDNRGHYPSSSIAVRLSLDEGSSRNTNSLLFDTRVNLKMWDEMIFL